MTPHFKPGVRLHWDRVRARHVLLAPERIVDLDEIAFAILSRVDGRTDLDVIARALAGDYEADPAEIAADAGALLGDLRSKGYVGL